MCPIEVADDLIAAGEADASPNPMGEFSAGDWANALLMVTVIPCNAVTLVGGLVQVGTYARRMHAWNHANREEPDDPPRTLSYRSSAGSATLEMNKTLPLPVLQAWLEVAYLALESDTSD